MCEIDSTYQVSYYQLHSLLHFDLAVVQLVCRWTPACPEVAL